MKRLCFGSYIKILTLCKSAVGKSQKNICGKVILCFALPGHDYCTNDATTSDFVLCRGNLPQDVVDAAHKIDATADKNALREYFKTNVICLVDSNKKSDIVLALKDIIANDTHIKPDTVVDKVAGLTKSALSKTDTFVFEDFLAGIFLYTVTVVVNTDGKDSAKTLDKAYMSQFANRENEVEFVDRLNETSGFDEAESYSAEADCEFADEFHIENDFIPRLQQNIYNQTIDVKGNGNLVNGFVFNINNRG